MSAENVTPQEHGVLHRSIDALRRPAKVIGVTALSAAAGYAVAKGFDTFVMPVELNEVYETASAIGGALLGGFIAAETIDS